MMDIDLEQPENYEVSSSQKTEADGELSRERSVGNSSDDDQDAPVVRKKRIQLLPDSDSDTENVQNGSNNNKSPVQNSSDESDANIFKKVSQKLSKHSDNSSSSEAESNENELSRIKNKRNKLMQKFKGLVKTRVRDKIKDSSPENGNDSDTKKSSSEHNSELSEDEESSIERIKQKINERTKHLKTTIYDPDTSDEDSSLAHKINISNKPRKSTKMTSPKAARLSAKQAMENMKKIKSESNRMLREKEVSLPYHRPKALSLKDIMNRRRLAVAADGKALPIKMNEEQLKQYALSLEQRQKEVIELCKSDTEEEEEQSNANKETSEETQSKNDTFYDSILDSTKTNQIDGDELKTGDNNDVINERNSNNKSVSDKEDNHEATDNINSVKETNIDGIEGINANFDEIPNNEVAQGNNIEEVPVYNIPKEKNYNSLSEDNPSTTLDGNESAEMSLVYNSADDTVNDEAETNKDINEKTELCEEETTKVGYEESQLISLHYDTEMMDTERIDQTEEKEVMTKNQTEQIEMDDDNNEFLDDGDMNVEDIDQLIENAEILSQNNMNDVNSPMLVKDTHPLKTKPKLTGAPGMVIDLDGTDPCQPKKLTGVELLKERFTYFAKFKTPEEMEREKEKRIKPGVQHLKLKQALEDQIAEQRSIEWFKRLEEEKQQQKEIDAIRGDGSDNEDDIDAIEAKLEEKELEEEEKSSSEGEEDEEEDDMVIEDKPRKQNPMIADEADESDDCDEDDGDENTEGTKSINEPITEDVEEGDIEDNDEMVDDEEESDESSEEEEEIGESKPKKGRILKAFEDSDDESPLNVKETETMSVKSQNQDDELQLAQMQKSCSDDPFTTQEHAPVASDKNVTELASNTEDLGTQSFSIMNSVSGLKCPITDDLEAMDSSQNLVEGNLKSTTSQFLNTQKSQEIGEDLLALCTGNFYDNKFVSQLDEENIEATYQTQKSIDKEDVFEIDKDSQESSYSLKVNNNGKSSDIIDKTPDDMTRPNEIENSEIESNETVKEASNDTTNDNEKQQTKEAYILNSILDELNEPEPVKVNKFFTNNTQNGVKDVNAANTQAKKKFVIDSDDEGNNAETTVKTKKFKKKKLEQRALQISDDEDEDLLEEGEEELLSEPEDETERLVEYDSEENEVEIVPQPKKKLKKRIGEFFENEAELTSEDEWVGSGDEDEAGLDRLEREDGDDDTFHQGKLQRELGQIHMRDVLDQDKREVRLIQELLFEDGDLGDGHRQRKFRWKNTGAEDGDTPLDLLDSQEEEFESEEQWRKQRHEREMFLKQMQDKEESENTPNVTLNRSSIIKASLSKTSTNIVIDLNASSQTEVTVPPKKTAKDIPSPKKPFTLLQQNYHKSLLTRGRGALARLAALATPLAEDDDAPKIGSLAPSSKRNFVFAAITPDEKEPKVSKRKAELNVGTPRLVKKMKSEEKNNHYKSSLLDLI